jgi:hypothetical protein
VLALSLTLIRAADTYYKSVTTPIVTLIFLGCIAWALPRQRRSVFLTGSACLVFVFAADISLALVRGAQDGAYSNMTATVGRIVLYLTVLMLGIVSLTSARDVAERDRRLMAIVLAPVVYALINGLLTIGGVQAPIPVGATAGERASAGSQSQLLGFLGIAGGREQFPLATSINLYSIAASAAFAGLAVLRIRAPERLPRMVAWPGMAICLFEVLVGDSRATLAAAVGVVLVFLIWRRFAGTSVVALLIPLFPLIVIGLLSVIGNTGIGSLLNRGGVGAGQNNFGSVASGTGRVYIWRGAWQVLKHFRLQDVIGWGAAGQIPSGASLHYILVFPQNNLAYTAFTHNLTLQVILDEGYLGLLILVAVLARTFILLKRHVREEPRSPAVALVAMLLVFVISGATEVSPTYYTEEVLIMTLLIAGAAAALAGSPRPSQEFGEALDERLPLEVRIRRAGPSRAVVSGRSTP